MTDTIETQLARLAADATSITATLRDIRAALGLPSPLAAADAQPSATTATNGAVEAWRGRDER